MVLNDLEYESLEYVTSMPSLNCKPKIDNDKYQLGISIQEEYA